MSSYVTTRRRIAEASDVGRRVSLRAGWTVPAGILILAAVLRLIGLSGQSLLGDEYLSIDEASTHFGVNLTSLLYSAILHGFMIFGNSVVLLRLPAVIFGIAAVPAIYLLGRELVDERTGLVAALLLATSSYAIDHSQEVRFYSMFLCAGILALYALTLVLRHGPSRGRIAFLIAANLFCLAAQGMGMLIVAAEVVSLLLVTAPPGRLGRRVLVLCGGAVLGGLVLADHQVRVWGTAFLNRYQESHAVYTGARGLHLANLVKVGWTYFVFTFGERVYPLWLWITVPGVVLVAVLAAWAIWTQRRNRVVLGVLLPPLILAPALLYLVFDALIPASGLPSASPRYVTPVLAPFCLLLAIGITSWRRPRSIALSLLFVLALNAIALTAYWQDSWSYGGRAPDWGRAAHLVDRFAIPGTVVALDGRSRAPARYYLQQVEQAHHLAQRDLEWPTTVVRSTAPRIIAISNTDQPFNQSAINRTLDALQQRYVVTDGYVQYPLFVYVLDRTRGQPARSGWRSAAIPVDVYDISLQDLALPARITSGAGGLVTHGGFALGASAGMRSRTVRLPAGGVRDGVLLATTLQEDAGLPAGTPIASLTLSGAGSRRVIVLRKGQQVDDWKQVGSGGSASGQYQRGYTWTKLIDLVGTRAYPDAYRQFRAGMAVSRIPVVGGRYTSASLHYLAPAGILHVWALATR